MQSFPINIFELLVCEIASLSNTNDLAIEMLPIDKTLSLQRQKGTAILEALSFASLNIAYMSGQGFYSEGEDNRSRKCESWTDIKHPSQHQHRDWYRWGHFYRR